MALLYNPTLIDDQTVISLPFSYVVGGNQLFVFWNGQYLTNLSDYTETLSTEITLVRPVEASDIITVVKVTEPTVFSLNDLIDVNTTGVINGDTLVYNVSTLEWEPAPPLAGPPGPQGPPGLGNTWITGVGPPSNLDGNIGDLYLDTSTGNYYQKNYPLIWELKGCLVGPIGPQGIQGIPGQDGVDGSQGPQGIQGPQGSTWITGATSPNSLIGNVNDLYLDTTTNTYYLKTDLTTWTLQGYIQGAIGPQGIQGIPGPVGPPGPPGTSSGSGSSDNGQITTANILGGKIAISFVAAKINGLIHSGITDLVFSIRDPLNQLVSAGLSLTEYHDKGVYYGYIDVGTITPGQYYVEVSSISYPNNAAIKIFDVSPVHVQGTGGGNVIQEAVRKFGETFIFKHIAEPGATDVQITIYDINDVPIISAQPMIEIAGKGVFKFAFNPTVEGTYTGIMESASSDSKAVTEVIFINTGTQVPPGRVVISNKVGVGERRECP